MGDRQIVSDRLKPWLLAVAAALPFQILIFVDLWQFGSSATGFVMTEMPYYAANARAYFDHGNGFMHPNPYDAHGATIYFQLSTWLLGVIWWMTRIDPGVIMATLGFIFAILTGRVTYALVKERLKDQRYQTPIFFLIMFAGGLLVMRMMTEMGVRAMLGTSLPTYNLLSYDTSTGWWFLSWGRNVVLTTEAMYRFLMAAAWLMFLRERWLYAIVLSAIVAAAHPWTGVLSISIMSVWIIIGGRERIRNVGYPALALGIATALAFAWYYGYYLNLFPSHRAISENWTLEWTLKTQALLLSLAVPAALAIYFALKRFSFGRQEAFLATCFIVTLIWSKHDLFMHPIQPLHFNRGYPWFALTLLALPAAPMIIEQFGKTTAVLLIAILLSDNIGFFYQEIADRTKQHPKLSVTLQPDIKSLFHYADEQDLRGILLTDHPVTNYLAPTYCKLTPYIGHQHLTPGLDGKLVRSSAFISGADPSLADSIDFFLCHDTCKAPRSSFTQLKKIGEHGLYRVAR